MTARNRVVREPYATWCGRTPVEIIHGLLPDFSRKTLLIRPSERLAVEACEDLLLGLRVDASVRGEKVGHEGTGSCRR